MSERYAPVPKEPSERFFELIQSLRVLADSIQLLRSPGKAHQILPIAGQLRALLTDRSTEPLLLDLAKSAGDRLQVYVAPGVAQKRGPLEPDPDILLKIGGIQAARHPFEESDVAMDLVDYLHLPVVRFRDTAYSVRDMIEVMANRAGGAHFAPDLPRDLADLMRQIGIGGLPPPAAILVQLAEVVLDLGRDLVRRTGECEVHFAMALRPESQEQPRRVFEAKLPGTAALVTGIVDPMHRVHIFMRGLDGSKMKLPTMRRVDWSESHHFAMTSAYTDELNTSVELLVDGQVHVTQEVPFPLVLHPGIAEYDVTLNGEASESAKGLRFGIVGPGILPLDRSIEGRGEIFRDFRHYCSDPSQQFVWFDPHESARLSPGSATEYEGSFRIEAYAEGLQRWQHRDEPNEAG